MMKTMRAGSRWAGAVLLVWSMSLISARAFSQREGEGAASGSDNSKTEPEKRSNPALPHLMVDSQSGSPGTNVVVPLYLTPPQSAALKTVTVEIEWVSKNVQFVKLERGISAEAIGAAITGKVTGTSKDAKSIEHSRLRIEASVTDENPKEGFPDGLLAYLTFRISADAQPFAVELRPKLIAAEAIRNAGKKFTQAEVEPGQIRVELPGLPPYVTCFFFNH